MSISKRPSHTPFSPLRKVPGEGASEDTFARAQCDTEAFRVQGVLASEKEMDMQIPRQRLCVCVTSDCGLASRIAGCGIHCHVLIFSRGASKRGRKAYSSAKVGSANVLAQVGLLAFLKREARQRYIAPESSVQKLLLLLLRCRSHLLAACLVFWMVGFFIPQLIYMNSRMTLQWAWWLFFSPHFTPDEGCPASEAQEPDGS
jgi:hypothetical protein